MLLRAYILTGGQSSRFGSDKGKAEIAGVPNVVRIATHLKSMGIESSLVAQTVTDFHEFGIDTIVDHVKNGGPLAGVLASLIHAKSISIDYALLVTCDLLNWNNQWIESMQRSVSSEADHRSVDICVLESIDFAPFPGLYSTRLVDPVQQLWDTGTRSLRALHALASIQVRKTPFKATDCPITFNTQDELRRWCQAN